MRDVKCKRSNSTEITLVPFGTLEEGDVFFVDGEEYVVGDDAHYSCDASYDGYLLYDENGEAWFPEDLD